MRVANNLARGLGLLMLLVFGSQASSVHAQQPAPETAPEAEQARTPEQESGQAESPPSEAAAPPAAPAAPSVARGESRVEEIQRQLEELERQRENLDGKLESTREEMEELDRLAEEVARKRTELAREEERRLEEARRELEQTERELRRAQRDAEREAEREAELEERDRGDENDWRQDARKRRNAGEKFGFGSTVKVRSGDVVQDVIAIVADAKVDGEVIGDVTTFRGSSKINGRVSGSVTAVGGNVELGPEARVEGDVSSFGGRIIVDPSAYIGGEMSQGGAFDLDDLDINRGDIFGAGRSFGRATFLAGWFQFFWALIFTGFLVILTGVIYLLFRRPVERVRDEAFDAPLKSLVIGFLILVLSIPVLVAVMVVLAISIIGIPFLVILVLLLPFILIGFGLAILYGYSAIALGVGSVVRSQLRLSVAGGLAMVAIGVVTLRAMDLSGDLLDAVGLPGFVTILFAFSGFVIQLLALCTGLGAVVASRFGLAPDTGGPNGVGTVPPPSDLPPIPTIDGSASDADDRDWMDETLDEALEESMDDDLFNDRPKR